ncbi:hypothetical protein LguiB_028621 [Lonicera macranthoides]
MDFRYLLPLFIKLLLLSFLANPPRFQYSQYILLVLKLVSSLLIAILTILVLFFSIEPSRAGAAVHLRGKNFSALGALSLLCSVFLSPHHFSMVYPLILCLSPWDSLILKGMKWVFSWLYPWDSLILKGMKWVFTCLYHRLEAIPDLTIVCITQQEENDHIQIQVQVQVEDEIDGLEDDPGQVQANLEEAGDALV